MISGPPAILDTRCLDRSTSSPWRASWREVQGRRRRTAARSAEARSAEALLATQRGVDAASGDHASRRRLAARHPYFTRRSCIGTTAMQPDRTRVPARRRLRGSRQFHHRHQRKRQHLSGRRRVRSGDDFVCFNGAGHSMNPSCAGFPLADLIDRGTGSPKTGYGGSATGGDVANVSSLNGCQRFSGLALQ